MVLNSQAHNQPHKSQVTDSKSRQEVQASKNYRDVAICRHTRMGHEEQQGPRGSTAH